MEKQRLRICRAKLKLVFSLILALLALLDNVTTVLALERGAVELNPIVSFFTTDTLLFALFTAVKVFLAFYVTYKTFSTSVTWIAIYVAVATVFARATVINIMNAAR
jgi:hypothetical protein